MSPQRSVGDDPDARVSVRVYSDLAAKKRGLTNRQVETPQRGLSEFVGGERA